MALVELPDQLHCSRCEHDWTPRGKDVRICPSCKSPYWDRPRETEEIKLTHKKRRIRNGRIKR